MVLVIYHENSASTYLNIYLLLPLFEMNQQHSHNKNPTKMSLKKTKM